jgi:phosphatidylinositol alpha-1,6-mannosyltransferase
VKRVIVLTPLMGGADGISEMTRQWVRVLEGHLGHGIETLDVWSLDDESTPAAAATVSRFRSARGGRLRFSSYAVAEAASDAAGTLVIVMHLQLLPVALPLALRGARVVSILMGIEAWKPMRPLERATLQRAWKIVAISAHTIERFKRANPVFAETPIAVCPPGAPEMLTPAADRLAGPYALIVGRMSARERYKGHDVLIDTWPRVRQAIPAAQLVIAGDGDDMARLRDKAARVCGDGVIFAGRVDGARLAALYRDATVFVMPSTEEGFGLVYLEAMTASVPCVAAHGAAEEIITDGRDGFIVDVTNRDALVDAIVGLLGDASLRSRMAAAAGERVREQFGAVALARRVGGVLDLVPAL